MKNNIFIAFLYVATSLCLFSCHKDETTQATTTHTHTAEEKHEKHENTIIELTEKQVVTTGIEFGKIEKQNLNSVLKVNGLLDVPPQNLVSISAVMGGFLRKTAIIQGMEVKKGDVLAVIENQDFIQMQQDYLDTKAKLEYTTLEYKRQEELSKENVSSTKTFQQITADYKSLQAKFAALQQRLQTVGISIKELETGKITNSVAIYSPIAGYVTTVNVNIGKFVNSADVLFEIVDTDHLHVELSLFEQDIAKIAIGQKIHFFLANEPNKERMATVYLINPKINTDRTIRVHCHLDKKELNLMPNTYLKAIIDLGENTVSSLPEDAVVNFEEKEYIFVLKSKSKETPIHYDFEMLEIQKGNTERNFTEVILPQNFDIATSQIVIKGAYSLLAHYKNENSEGEEGHGH
jgi:cobalt-zinc-cadmium efflux system membrane fusion protein